MSCECAFGRSQCTGAVAFSFALHHRGDANAMEVHDPPNQTRYCELVCPSRAGRIEFLSFTPATCLHKLSLRVADNTKVVAISSVQRYFPKDYPNDPVVGNDVSQDSPHFGSSQRLTQALLQLYTIGSAHARTVAVLQNDLELAVRNGLKLKNIVNIDDGRSMNADESHGIETSG